MGRHGWGAIVTGAGDTKSDSGWGGLPLFLVEQILEMKHNVQMVFSMFFFSPLCLCYETGEVTIDFYVAQGRWPFVISKKWLLCETSGHDNQDQYLELGLLVIEMLKDVATCKFHARSGSNILKNATITKPFIIFSSMSWIILREDHHNRATTATTSHHGLGGARAEKKLGK